MQPGLENKKKNVLNNFKDEPTGRKGACRKEGSISMRNKGIGFHVENLV